MPKIRKPVEDRSKDRPGVTSVNLRLPDDLLVAVDRHLAEMNADPTVPQWTRTSLILNLVAKAAKEWGPAPAKKSAPK